MHNFAIVYWAAITGPLPHGRGSDTDNVRNVAADLKYAETKRRLREKMEELLRAEGDPRLLGNADFFETIGWTGNRKQAFDTWLRNHQPER